MSISDCHASYMDFFSSYDGPLIFGVQRHLSGFHLCSHLVAVLPRSKASLLVSVCVALFGVVSLRLVVLLLCSCSVDIGFVHSCCLELTASLRGIIFQLSRHTGTCILFDIFKCTTFGTSNGKEILLIQALHSFALVTTHGPENLFCHFLANPTFPANTRHMKTHCPTSILAGTTFFFVFLSE